MKKTVKYLIIAFCFFTINSCNEVPIVKDMVQFDQAFIPAFYYTYLGDLERAQKAMFPLNQKWQQFESFYGQKLAHSDDWNESIRLVGAWLEEASCAMKDQDALRALFQLDHARYELMDMRWRGKVFDYYLDYVWELEASIDVAVQVATDPMLDLLEWKQFQALCEDVDYAWQKVLEQPLPNETFGFTTKQAVQFSYQKTVLNNSINVLMEAVKTADSCQFSEAAQAIEPAYLNFIAVFGDFEATASYFAWSTN